MDKVFVGVSLFDFVERFKTDDDCKAYLAYHKWERKSFQCSCGHTGWWEGTKPFTKVCSSCRKLQSSTSDTHFHKVKFGLRKAFMIIFEMMTNTKSTSANQIAKRYGIKYEAAWLFMRKVRNAVASPGNIPMIGDIMVDEFVIGGFEPGAVGRKTDSKKIKVIAAIELHRNIGIKRGYAMVIDNYGSKELGKIFSKHIDKSAKIMTDKWKGYVPLMKDFDITQEVSEGGVNFTPMNRFIQGLKSWLRGIHHHVDKYHIQAYLDEYCYRFNRHFCKEVIFDETIERMVDMGETNKKKLANFQLPTYEERRIHILCELLAKGELPKVA